MNNLLEVRHLNKEYDTFQLRDVSFKLPAGSIMGFIGENGAGKTTTIKSILNLISYDSGEIDIFKERVPLQNLELKEDIGVVLDAGNFPDFVTVNQIDRIMKDIYRNWDSKQYFNLLQKFSLPENKMFSTFSKGMQMKLAISVALSHHARLLILDEPTSGLDPIVRDEILDIFLEFIQDESQGILVSSHIIGDLEKIADYITFIHQGEIIFSESKDELLEKYQLVHCTDEEFDTIQKNAIIGSRRNSFGINALILRQPEIQVTSEKASIEDIMLYHIKGEQR